MIGGAARIPFQNAQGVWAGELELASLGGSRYARYIDSAAGGQFFATVAADLLEA